MTKNMGDGDRTIRILVAALIIIFYLVGVFKGMLAIALLIVGGIFLLTSFIGICPIYSLLGINTCKVKKTS
ncbi:MAG: hypothetical protein BGO55_26460 [Sphingobacteriales bacterium 50-39]|nr:DUF2892 domain-containing protein [Sphingobacteriales bacterium]OJW56436.1 MAG: hypothetical protein BGO55_26460 [Sphingobacteriales bacterium 50-39]